MFRWLASNSAINQPDESKDKEPASSRDAKQTVSWFARNFDALAGAGASCFTSPFTELTEGF